MLHEVQMLETRNVLMNDNTVKRLEAGKTYELNERNAFNLVNVGHAVLVEKGE